jgi:hypothetical protein
MNPVDFVAKFICDLTEDYEDSKYIDINHILIVLQILIFLIRLDLGLIFNLYNPNRVEFDRLVDKLDEIANLDVNKLPYLEWKRKVLPKLGKSSDLDPKTIKPSPKISVILNYEYYRSIKCYLSAWRRIFQKS